MALLTAAMGFVSTSLNDLQVASLELAVCAIFAFIMGFVYMFILKCCAACLTWFFIIGFNLLWLALAGFTY